MIMNEYDAEKTMNQFKEEYLREGFIRGFIIGYLQGYIQANEEMALQMYRDNVPLDFIKRYTGIGAERLRVLRQTNRKHPE